MKTYPTARVVMSDNLDAPEIVFFRIVVLVGEVASPVALL